MQKENKSLKNIIILLAIVIVLLIGFGIILMIELHDEKEDLDKFFNSPSNNSSYSNDYTHHDDEEYVNPDNPNYITKEQALNIALNHAKLSSKDVYEIDIELDYKYNQTVYEIDFKYQQYEYEYYINATNSSIIKSFREIDY